VEEGRIKVWYAYSPKTYGVIVSVLSLSLRAPTCTTPQELFSRVGPADESVKEKAEAFKQQG